MLSKRVFLKLTSVLLIVLSFSLCLYAIGKHQTSETPSTRGMFVQNQNSGAQNPQPGGSFAQGQNRLRPNENDRDNQRSARSNAGTNAQTPSNGGFHSNGQRSFNQGMPSLTRGMGTGSQSYAVQVVVYALLFFFAVLAAYLVLTRMKIGGKIETKMLAKFQKIDKGNQRILILTLFLVGLFLRIALGILIEGHPFDLNTFKSWATSAANNFSQFYAGRHASDYPPLYIYILYLVGKIGSLKAMNPYFTILLKLPSILADMGTALLLFKLARKYLTAEMGILMAAFYIFNPAVFVNSTLWGQVDSFFTLLVVAAIVLLGEEKIVSSTIFFTAAVLMKPQGIIFLPVLFFELVRRRSWKSIIKVLISSLLTAIIIVLPFSANQDVLWIFKLFTSTVGEYPYASVNAFNLFYLLGANYLHDTSILVLFSYHTWGLIFIILVTLLAWLMFAKGKNRHLASVAALILIAGVFIFSASMHERYLFPAAALAALAYIYTKDRRFILLSTGFSITIFANTYDILCQTSRGIDQAALSAIPAATSILNLLLFMYLLKVIYDLTLKEKFPQF